MKKFLMSEANWKWRGGGISAAILNVYIVSIFAPPKKGGGASPSVSTPTRWIVPAFGNMVGVTVHLLAYWQGGNVPCSQEIIPACRNCSHAFLTYWSRYHLWRDRQKYTWRGTPYYVYKNLLSYNNLKWGNSKNSMYKWHNDMYIIFVVKQFTMSWSVVDEVILKIHVHVQHK